MKEIRIDDYERKEIFQQFNNEDNPFIYITIKLDVTNVYNYCNQYKHHYATMGYLIGKTVNEVDSFRYRLVDDKIIQYDKVGISYTQRIDQGIGFYDTEYNESFKEYIREYDRASKDFYDGVKNKDMRFDQIWVSCTPWYDFTGLVTPFDKRVTIPQFIWGKYFNENGKVYVHLMIMANHGFVDGEHIGLFISRLEENIENFGKERDE